jgi:hypothetical protein
MRKKTGPDLTDADLSDTERAAVERVVRLLELAFTIAASPDQIHPIAQLLAAATTAAEVESMNADFERLIRRSD